MTLKSDTGRPLRPDGVFRTSDGCRMLFKWEDKSSQYPLQDAIEDLHAKTAVWSPLYYGDLGYLICAAAAGAHFQFFVVLRGDPGMPQPISPMYNLCILEDRAKLAIASVHVYRLLRAVNR